MKDNKKFQINIFLEEEYAKAVKIMAIQKNTTVSELIQDLIREEMMEMNK